MKLVSDVFEIAESFMVAPYHAYIIPERFNGMATVMKNEGKPTFPIPIVKNIFKGIVLELVAASVNYCYWFGSHSIRPEGCNSVKMYEFLDESFIVMNKLREMAMYDPQHEVEIIIDTFIDKLSIARFPLLDHRIRHLTEVRNRLDLVHVIDRCVSTDDFSVDGWLQYLVRSFPGYGKDLFLKRAFLFIIQMYRRLRLFKEGMDRVSVPADYQIPKVLRSLGCLKYNYPLDFMVKNGRLIPEGSTMETEIRAATIVVCSKIATLAQCYPAEVDTYLFAKRNACKDPFHLTITTNY